MTEPRYYGPRGPYDTESEARSASAYELFGLVTREGHNRQRLQNAIEHAGVEVGSYDRTVLEQLATLEPWTVEVVAALIERAASVERAADPGER